jgi:hypothetical protein
MRSLCSFLILLDDNECLHALETAHRPFRAVNTDAREFDLARFDEVPADSLN